MKSTEIVNRLPLADTSLVNYYGRNYVTNEKVTFLNTSSGFEVCFTGTELRAVFTRRGCGPVGGDETAPATLLRLRVYRDGDMTVESSTVVVLDESTDGKEIVLASFATEGDHKVLVRKMNYEWWGYAELLSLSTDGSFLPAPAKPAKHILVYGDSITAAYGVEYAATGDAGGDVPEKEDGTRAWAALFADACGAQITEYCISGVSIGVPCWREKPIMWDNIWRQYAFFDTGSDYDMEHDIPDLVLCNLGSNDNGGLADGCSNFGNGTAYAPAGHYTRADLEKAYADFIAAMKGLYPHAPIILGYGMLGTGPDVMGALLDAVDACGYPDVYALNFTTVEYSANAGHPTLAGQEDGYRQLVKFMENNNITF